MTFQIADEAANLDVPKIISDGEGKYVKVTDDKGKEVTVKGKHAVGKRYKSQGVWLTPSPPSGQGWINGKYKEFIERIGVEFPLVEGKTKLMEVEEEDVIVNDVKVEAEKESPAPVWREGDNWYTTLKIDGEDIKVPFNDLKSSHQKDRVSQKRFEEAAEYGRARNEQAFKTLLHCKDFDSYKPYNISGVQEITVDDLY